MKKLLTMLVVFVYFVPISLILTFYLIFTRGEQNSSMLITFTIPLILMLVVCVLVVVNAVGAATSIIKSQCLSFRTALVYKLCLIPFYLINFICWMIASMVFHIALVIWPFIPFIIAYTYITMLGTSVHVISKLFTLWQSQKIITKQFVVHCIMQLVFTVDVIDSVYLAIKQRKFEPTQSSDEDQN